MLQLLHGGASTFIQIPTGIKGANTLYPTHGTRSKYDLMIEAKDILIGSSGFLGIILFVITTATHFKIGLKKWGFNGFNVCFIQTRAIL